MSQERIKKYQIETLMSHVMGDATDKGLGMKMSPEYWAYFGKTGANPRGKMNVLGSVAWAKLKNRQNPDVEPNIILAGNHQWNEPGEPAKEPLGWIQAMDTINMLARFNAHATVTLLKSWLDEETGLRYPIVDTSTEVMAHIQYAQEIGATTLGSVSSNTHTYTIEQHYGLHLPKGMRAKVFGAEAMLENSADFEEIPEVTSLIEQVTHSKDEWKFRAQEVIKFAMLGLLGPKGEEMIRDKALEERVVGQYITDETEVFQVKAA